MPVARRRDEIARMSGRARDRSVPGRLRSRRSLSATLASITRHRYLADGSNLCRFIGWGAGKNFAELEDGRSLELLIISPSELACQHLRPVAPSDV
jgi:hypothetical protein